MNLKLAPLSVVLSAAALMLSPLHAAAETVRIGILHVNDVYQIRPDNGQKGGIARAATLRQQLAPQYDRLFFTFGGDTLSPSVTSSTFKGKQMIAAWNEAGLDVAVLGNHEFDHGQVVLEQRLQESNFPWLAANLMGKASANQETAQALPNVLAYQRYEVAGMKIAFLGVITENTVSSSRAGATMRFQPAVDTACATAKRLRESHQADVVVALTHIDVEDDRKLAATCPVDLILGGHDHIEVSEQVNGKPIAKAGSDAAKAVLAEISIDSASHLPAPVTVRLIPLDANIPENAAVREVAQQYEGKLQQELKKPIGQTIKALDARTQSVRMHATNAGTLVAEAFRSGLNADFAIVNGGSLRSDKLVGPGVLRRQDIKQLLPFENHVYKLSLTGEALLQVMKNLGTALGQRPQGRYPHVAGLQLVWEGGQIATVHDQHGKPLSPNRVYTLAVTDFLAEGNNGYDGLKRAKRLNTEDTAPIETELVMQYIEKKKVIR